MHGDVSPVLRASISVSNLAFKWGEIISMGEVLYSTKWVKYSTLPRATTQHTTTTHNNQHEPPPPHPSVALALSLHSNILHWPKSWCRCSLWVHRWCNASGVLSLLFYPSFGAPKCNQSTNRWRVGVLALGGHSSVILHSNNIYVSVGGGEGIREETRLGQNMWGATFTCCLGRQTEQKN